MVFRAQVKGRVALTPIPGKRIDHLREVISDAEAVVTLGFSVLD